MNRDLAEDIYDAFNDTLTEFWGLANPTSRRAPREDARNAKTRPRV